MLKQQRQQDLVSFASAYCERHVLHVVYLNIYNTHTILQSPFMYYNHCTRSYQVLHTMFRIPGTTRLALHAACHALCYLSPSHVTANQLCHLSASAATVNTATSMK